MGNKKAMTLQTRLNVDECRKRLHQRPRDQYKINQFDLGFSISTRGDKFNISKITQLPNIFRPNFSGILQSENGKTKISGHFYTMLFAKLYFGLFLGVGTLVILVVSIGFILATIEGKGPPLEFLVPFSIFPLIWLGLFSSITVIGRWLARNDKKEIVNYLEELFELK